MFNIIDHPFFITFMLLVTIWALFGDDIRQISVEQDKDNIFYTISFLSLLCFCLEIALTFYCNKSYRWSFFFFLDILSTASLVLDIRLFQEWIGISDSSASGAKSATQLAKAARASRIGTRAGRIVRIIRLVRLIRIVKIYKASQQAKEKQEANQERSRREKLKKKRKMKRNIDGESNGSNIFNEFFDSQEGGESSGGLEKKSLGGPVDKNGEDGGSDGVVKAEELENQSSQKKEEKSKLTKGKETKEIRKL